MFTWRYFLLSQKGKYYIWSAKPIVDLGDHQSMSRRRYAVFLAASVFFPSFNCQDRAGVAESLYHVWRNIINTNEGAAGEPCTPQFSAPKIPASIHYNARGQKISREPHLTGICATTGNRLPSKMIFLVTAR